MSMFDRVYLSSLFFILRIYFRLFRLLLIVKSIDEAATILLPQTPDKMRELVELTFCMPPKFLPSCVLTDFIRVRSSKLYAPHTQTHTA
ncbi:hypothetical protein HYC85_017471 [Camellia sinensis]|uniref:Uncharacterized protein n=1 Tax=Camellia sinensis TaxID=4442 RepID=A0A7J7GVC8_CAMSI|nr:hypothetical protein HYC85_017471 [Camellia sinensis]